ncbi:hypothetical protein F8M41_001342 [Gigaspora margarita]|uniref:Uncharacterized protein n=1 Tax=Gigaspora margarita TaxID=4874 RepID=A0A8H4A872_GIGMA|nr:hypothetical protein F8M41_001342 [Gigaspora margarita]
MQTPSNLLIRHNQSNKNQATRKPTHSLHFTYPVKSRTTRQRSPAPSSRSKTQQSKLYLEKQNKPNEEIQDSTKKGKPNKEIRLGTMYLT